MSTHNLNIVTSVFYHFGSLVALSYDDFTLSPIIMETAKRNVAIIFVEQRSDGTATEPQQYS